MIFIFDLDDTLVSGDIVRDISAKMVSEGLIDKIYSNDNISNYDLRDLPENVQTRVKKAFADPDYVWIKKPISGTYYFLRYLEEQGHKIGVITARPTTTSQETIRFMIARFPNIKFNMGIHIINTHNHIDMQNVPSKQKKLEELSPDFYFDDNTDYCLQSYNSGIQTFLISNKRTPWNHEFAESLKKLNHSITVLRNVSFFPETRL